MLVRFQIPKILVKPIKSGDKKVKAAENNGELIGMLGSVNFQSVPPLFWFPQNFGGPSCLLFLSPDFRLIGTYKMFLSPLRQKFLHTRTTKKIPELQRNYFSTFLSMIK